MPHMTSRYIDQRIGLLEPRLFRDMNDVLKRLLTEVHLAAGQDRAINVIELVEEVADDLGIEITHDEENAR